jgi:hypothetical protein
MHYFILKNLYLSLSFGTDYAGFIGGLDFIGLKNVVQAPSPIYASTVPYLADLLPSFIDCSATFSDPSRPFKQLTTAKFWCTFQGSDKYY